MELKSLRIQGFTPQRWIFQKVFLLFVLFNQFWETRQKCVNWWCGAKSSLHQWIYGPTFALYFVLYHERFCVQRICFSAWVHMPAQDNHWTWSGFESRSISTEKGPKNSELKSHPNAPLVCPSTKKPEDRPQYHKIKHSRLFSSCKLTHLGTGAWLSVTVSILVSCSKRRDKPAADNSKFLAIGLSVQKSGMFSSGFRRREDGSL